MHTLKSGMFINIPGSLPSLLVMELQLEVSLEHGDESTQIKQKSSFVY